MKQIRIIQAKPNPLGSDRYHGITPDQQRAGEWVDIKNIGDESFPLGRVKLQHIAYTPKFPNGVWTEVMIFSGNLGAEEVMRIHSGHPPVNGLLSVDSQGANYHLYSGKDYVWNNNKKDTALLTDKFTGIEIDRAGYVNDPPDGKILKRLGNLLV